MDENSLREYRETEAGREEKDGENLKSNRTMMMCEISGMVAWKVRRRNRIPVVANSKLKNKANQVNVRGVKNS